MARNTRTFLAPVDDAGSYRIAMDVPFTNASKHTLGTVGVAGRTHPTSQVHGVPSSRARAHVRLEVHHPQSGVFVHVLVYR